MEAQNELGYKALFGGLIFLLSFVSGAIPQFFAGVFDKQKNFIGIANAFGGGVFLATAFIHMLPELMHDIEHLNIGPQDFPFGFLLVLLGYLALLCLERVAFTHNHHHEEHHHHHGEDFYRIKHHPHHHPEHHNPALDSPTPQPTHDEHSPLVTNKHDHKDKPAKANPNINSHEHSHNTVSKLTPILLLAVLSVHSLFEGLVLGVQESQSDVLAISSAILSHKWVESLSLGLVSIKARASAKFAILIVGLFSLITPIGTLVGYLISNELQNSILPIIFNAIALGSFLYIGATEVVGDEFHDVKKKRIRWTKFISLVLGVTLLCFIRLFIGHDH